jgi:hypothetical protein
VKVSPASLSLSQRRKFLHEYRIFKTFSNISSPVPAENQLMLANLLTIIKWDINLILNYLTLGYLCIKNTQEIKRNSEP